MHRQLEQRVILEFNLQRLTAKQRPRSAENLSSVAGQQSSCSMALRTSSCTMEHGKHQIELSTMLLLSYENKLIAEALFHTWRDNPYQPSLSLPQTRCKTSKIQAMSSLSGILRMMTESQMKPSPQLRRLYTKTTYSVSQMMMLSQSQSESMSQALSYTRVLEMGRTSLGGRMIARLSLPS